ncbi:hypothetical protein HDU78_008295 [Chytriomyces hyalinus]|nr:hypothetical protein HDU78_008295 [Chytriomyces hyalinus]
MAPLQHYDALLADLDDSLATLLAGSCEVKNEKPPRLSDFTSSACNVISGYLNLITDGDDPSVYSRRFFVQFAGRLYMFKTADPSSLPLDAFNLRHPACVKLRSTPGIAHAFEVAGLTSSGELKSWILVANNRPLRKIWIEAISSKFKSGGPMRTEAIELQHELDIVNDSFNGFGQRKQSLANSTSSTNQTPSPVPELIVQSSMSSMRLSSLADSPTSSFYSTPSEHGSHSFKSAPMYPFLQEPVPTTSSSLRHSQAIRTPPQQSHERRRRSTVRSIVHSQDHELDFEYPSVKKQHWPKQDSESIASRESSWSVNLKRAGSRKNGKSITDNLSSAGLM